MTVRDAVESLNLSEKLVIYRTYGPNDEDMFVGLCKYDGKDLIPYDGDSYSLDDEIIGFKLDKKYLTVWYKSKWLVGEEYEQRFLE